MGKKYQTDSEATTNFRHVYTPRNFSKNKRNNLMIKKNLTNTLFLSHAIISWDIIILWIFNVYRTLFLMYCLLVNSNKAHRHTKQEYL